MARSPVTDLIQRYNALNEVEQKVFLDQVDPQPEPEQQPKKSNKKAASVTRKGRCAACDYAKAAPIHHDATLVGYHVYQAIPRSPRAQSISAAIAKTPKVDPANGVPCTYRYPKDGAVNPDMVCGEVAADTIHDETFGYAGYHPFVATAQTATRRSSRKGVVTNSTVNSETTAASAAVAAGGSSE